MRALLIDPFACRVLQIALPDPRESSPWEMLESIYAALSHATFKVDSLDGVALGKTDFLVVSGHGRIQEPPVKRWFRLTGLHFETLAGKGVIVGRDEEGTETDTNYLVPDIDYRAIFFEATAFALVQTVTPWRSQQ